MQILVVGAGVIGSVYGGRLAAVGHDVTLLAHGARLSELRSRGLVLEDAESGVRTRVPARAIGEITSRDRFDLVLVCVRFEQVAGTLPLLSDLRDGPDVLFLGNIAQTQPELTAALGNRVLLGFPAAAGSRDGAVVRYVLIGQQKTMLGEPDGTTTSRLRGLQRTLDAAGFSTMLSANVTRWLLGHTAFIVPIAFALYRCGVDPRRLATDRATMRLMVLATRQGFAALQESGQGEIPKNLRLLYRLPTAAVVAYWQRVFAGPRGELWFGAHTRVAQDELHTLAAELREAVRRAGRPTPDLDRLLSDVGAAG